MFSMVDSTWVRGERREGWREDVSFTSCRVISTSLRNRRGGRKEGAVTTHTKGSRGERTPSVTHCTTKKRRKELKDGGEGKRETKGLKDTEKHREERGRGKWRCIEKSMKEGEEEGRQRRR